MGSTLDDTFRILIATDNHLGYAEKDPERGNDSFETFEEILKLAVDQQVDFILLGGDLFHENKPSRQCLVKCMELLRKYTFGDKPVCFEYISDPTENFKNSKNPMVNFHDPNLNVSIPVFSIHGNHDDPSGLGQFCALDMLSTAGLVNYFGRTGDLKNITISPVLLEKGTNKLALFGLSAIKDERLFRLFKENKVKMMRPKEFHDEWFNIMVVHQNHTKHGMTNYLPEAFLDPFLHVVLWGHEHECLIQPRLSADNSFHVVQPGSSVVTSLCAGEAVEKHVALLEVNNKQLFNVTPLKLETVRPFIFDDVCLADQDLDYVIGKKETNPVEEFIEEHIRGMLIRAKEQLTGHPKQPKKPLIRLRVEYTDESQMFNTTRFGHKFTDEVANPNEMILFKKQRKEIKKNDTGIDKDAMDAVFAGEDVAETRVEDLVEQYFSELEDQRQKLFLLSERGLAKGVNTFVEKDDRDAISTVFKHQINKTMAHILSQDIDINEDNIVDEIITYREERLSKNNPQLEEQEAQVALSSTTRERRKVSDEDEEEMDDIDMDELSHPPARGRGSRGGRGRGSRGSRSRAGTSSASTTHSSSRNQLSLIGDGSPKVSESSSRARASRGRGRATTRNQSIMESFSRARTAASGRKGIVYDSDDD
ncbi:double-strand break repair protein MRE11-like [Penaeus japonicus]|uniref:double-strand break repair protein MRE11-like n=1 Tax=Penaeus japonicus TaxID=27405 RepID=UPI001C70C029|nr:double-strand break repair protein MRE11-like [Penaeus japonicus]XP_042860566.1 double-strand break repair protein MRE11-like [Penaeus japonicus]XP_042860567.1 double-strand break repair protein MRE11-like [Penaeus japonicus]XP_042867774.1 double-strand break repair protein MRE11-like [Penaeus japonicus]XP_042867775.1 double-strand break repair protein MRE11-like [Penaeus japonicus]XP_042867776.1 double-strand break repair protein MRE11-like [Penaeus japonicus]